MRRCSVRRRRTGRYQEPSQSSSTATATINSRMASRARSRRFVPVLAIVGLCAALNTAGPLADTGGRTFTPGQHISFTKLGLLDAYPCKLPAGASSLPAGTLHGLIGHLRQYPTLTLARQSQQGAARTILRRLENKARTDWATLAKARVAGYEIKTVPRAPGDLSAHYVHAERAQGPLDAKLNMRSPKALIYANEPGRPLVLVGVMFSMRRGVRGPTPGGAITRWHSHVICASGTKRGLAPLKDGSCPGGAKRHQGSEMMHIWFTADLRSAYAVHAPEPELCRDGLLRGYSCSHLSDSKGM